MIRITPLPRATGARSRGIKCPISEDPDRLDDFIVGEELQFPFRLPSGRNGRVALQAGADAFDGGRVGNALCSGLGEDLRYHDCVDDPSRTGHGKRVSSLRPICGAPATLGAHASGTATATLRARRDG